MSDLNEAKEQSRQILEMLGRENTELLLQIIHTADAVFPLLVKLREYTDAITEEVTSLLNRQVLVFPELRGYVCIAEYIAGEDGKRGLLFQIENDTGRLKVWYGDEDYSHLLGYEETGELVLSVNGDLPAHTAFFLRLLVKAHVQLFQQLSEYENGNAVLLLKPKAKN